MTEKRPGMTDEEVVAFYRQRYPYIGLETARALRRISGYRGAKSSGRPGGLADELPPGNPCGPALAIASGYAKGRPRRTADGL
jgi:hypothetical protein